MADKIKSLPAVASTEHGNYLEKIAVAVQKFEADLEGVKEATNKDSAAGATANSALPLRPIPSSSVPSSRELSPDRGSHTTGTYYKDVGDRIKPEDNLTCDTTAEDLQRFLHQFKSS